MSCGKITGCFFHHDVLLIAFLQLPAIAAQPEVQISFRAAREILKYGPPPDDLDDRDVTYLAPECHCLVRGKLTAIHPGDGLLETLDLIEQRIVPFQLGQLDVQIGAQTIDPGPFSKRLAGSLAQQLINIAIRLQLHGSIVFPD